LAIAKSSTKTGALKIGLYARVSTHDQQTLPMQIAAMRAYAKRRGWKVALEEKEVGSGAKTRPKREDMLTAARRREVDAIVVWRLDRWGRSLLELIATPHELHAVGVGFVSLTEALDMTTPAGRALAGMLAVFAEFERDILRDRVKAGIAEARKRVGRMAGHPASSITHQKYPLCLRGASASDKLPRVSRLAEHQSVECFRQGVSPR
jgi:putative DNA-invertase from lambdoid prophage Rac